MMIWTTSSTINDWSNGLPITGVGDPSTMIQFQHMTDRSCGNHKGYHAASRLEGFSKAFR